MSTFFLLEPGGHRAKQNVLKFIKKDKNIQFKEVDDLKELVGDKGEEKKVKKEIKEEEVEMVREEENNNAISLKERVFFNALIKEMSAPEVMLLPMINRRKPPKIDEQTHADCKICGKKVELKEGKYSKKDHAITHSKLKRFTCSYDGCEYQEKWYTEMFEHVRMNHGYMRVSMKKLARSFEQDEQLAKVLKRCFPKKVGKKEEVVKKERAVVKQKEKLIAQCELCKTLVTGTSIGSVQKKHAIVHIDFKLYKCIEPDCDYSSKYYQSIRQHRHKVHNKIACPETAKIALTAEQIEKMESTLYQCFPRFI